MLYWCCGHSAEAPCGMSTPVSARPYRGHHPFPKHPNSFVFVQEEEEGKQGHARLSLSFKHLPFCNIASLAFSFGNSSSCPDPAGDLRTRFSHSMVSLSLCFGSLSFDRRSFCTRGGREEHDQRDSNSTSADHPLGINSPNIHSLALLFEFCHTSCSH
jgi:hypothetical protein